MGGCESSEQGQGELDEQPVCIGGATVELLSHLQYTAPFSFSIYLQDTRHIMYSVDAEDRPAGKAVFLIKM